MGDPADDAPPLVAAPRHLRRRTFHEEVPDTLLVPDVEPYSLPTVTGLSKNAMGEPRKDVSDDPLKRQRLVALAIVVLVSLTIPILVLALVLAG
ncbi:hypothetical protein QK292_13225 [Arthrobacter sp. AL08]|uniref:hypothetical protein n=1 Tax=unclassified Arthrobacter TaxID=235627 RepID=UPI00249B1C6C|nr:MULTISPECIES: hypothetical protein [unclassified Arthrobacter]MDI3242480.1 hypothetical protein [Arthrobacter sp. AL05]MDI3278524.1 hypothetical protein [Arthrobacter sp. AL08]